MLSIRSSEVLGLRSTLTSCRGGKCPGGVIVRHGETCSTFIGDLSFTPKDRLQIAGNGRKMKNGWTYKCHYVKMLEVGLSHQMVQFVKGLKV